MVLVVFTNEGTCNIVEVLYCTEHILPKLVLARYIQKGFVYVRYIYEEHRGVVLSHLGARHHTGGITRRPRIERAGRFFFCFRV